MTKDLGDAIAALEAGYASLVAERDALARENEWLKQQLEPYLKHDEAIASARKQMRDELAAERTALQGNQPEQS